MAITIAGIKVTSITVKKESDKTEFEGEYKIMTSTDIVLARQTFGGYSDTKIPWSRETMDAAIALQEQIKADISKQIGIA